MNSSLSTNIHQFDIDWDPYGFMDDDEWFLKVEKTEDILKLSHINANGPIIDFGWYGSSYKIFVIETFHWDEPVEIIETKDIKEAARLINSLIDKYANGVPKP